MNHIEEMSKELRKVFNGLRDGTIDIKQATEMNNTAGKIISIAKVQLAYHMLTGTVPEMPFLDAKQTKMIEHEVQDATPR